MIRTTRSPDKGVDPVGKERGHTARNDGYAHYVARNRARGRWVGAGVAIGGIAGFVVGVVIQAWTAAFVSEQVMSGFYTGAVLGTFGYWLFTYDHGHRQKVIDDTRKEIVSLTALVKRMDTQERNKRRAPR